MQSRIAEACPFPRNGMDNYFFTTPALGLRMDRIQEYVRRGGTPVLILGELGAGKSTLLNQLSANRIQVHASVPIRYLAVAHAPRALIVNDGRAGRRTPCLADVDDHLGSGQAVTVGHGGELGQHRIQLPARLRPMAFDAGDSSAGLLQRLEHGLVLLEQLPCRPG